MHHFKSVNFESIMHGILVLWKMRKHLKRNRKPFKTTFTILGRNWEENGGKKNMESIFERKLKIWMKVGKVFVQNMSKLSEEWNIWTSNLKVLNRFRENWIWIYVWVLTWSNYNKSNMWYDVSLLTSKQNDKVLTLRLISWQFQKYIQSYSYIIMSLMPDFHYWFQNLSWKISLTSSEESFFLRFVDKFNVILCYCLKKKICNCLNFFKFNDKIIDFYLIFHFFSDP